jgi:hypothetical protein
MLHEIVRRVLGLGRWERFALFLWIVALLVISTRIVVVAQARGSAGGHASAQRAPHSLHSVYGVFVGAARHWLAGADLYEFPPPEDPYRYSPIVAVLFVPFAQLPDAVGGIAWRWLNAGVLLAGLWWWCRAVLPRQLSGRERAGLLLLVLPLVVGNFNNGQSNALVLGLLLAAIAGLAYAGKQRGDVWRGHLAVICVTLACLFKVYPLAVGLLLIVVRPRPFGGRLLVGLLVGLLLPFLFQRPEYVAEQYLGWVRNLQSDDRTMLMRELWYRDLRLLFATSGISLSQSAYLFIQVLTGAAMAGVCLVGRWHHWPQRRLLTLLTALGCCWMTVFGCAAESSTYILLAPTAAWCVLAAWLERTSWALRVLLLASYGLLLISQMAGWFPGGRAFHTLGPQPLAGLLLLTGVLAAAVRGLWCHALARQRGIAPASAGVG